ncbi:MAG: hypothetical protein KGM18_02955 [Sphingomonadales bacterium]|nr:hypothetical protein [Sphingomonadales bacterium]
MARINKAVDDAREKLRRKLIIKSYSFRVSIPFAMIAAVAIFSDLLKTLQPPPWLFSVELFVVALPLFNHLLWHAWQYGTGFPRSPTALPHAADQHIESSLAELRKESGIRAYSRSPVSGRYVLLNYRVFYGRLRYLILSEDFRDRMHVHSFPEPLPVRGELYIARSDAERLLAMSKPKRKAGPGRPAKYAYQDAILAVMADPQLHLINLADRAAAEREIERRLLNWFEKYADASADMPRADLVRPHANQIVDALLARA